MNEQSARNVVLVRAIESNDTERSIFSNEARTHASRAAAELARWRASERRQPASAETFVEQRAALLAETLPRRFPAIARAASAFDWPEWIGIALPLVSFALGALLEHIADRQHVNIIAFPLFAIVVWNVVVYLLLLLRVVIHAGGVRAALRGPRRFLAARTRRALRNLTAPSAAAAGAFVTHWSALVAPLMAARTAHVFHLSAALFAVGAVVGLYVRGLVFEYRAGWESTFLDPATVHAILSFSLSPAAKLLGTSFPSVEQIAALRFSSGIPGTANAALWIHLYAVTVGVVVVVPRLLLALIAGWQVKRRSQRFAFDMSEPYFRRLAGSFTSGVARLRVIPYSYTVDDAAVNGLRAVAVALLGDDAEVMLQPTVAFGAEDSLRQVPAADAPLTLALFSLAATPETENHGAFLKSLRASSASRLAVLVDESGYRRRLGTQAGAEARLEERRSAWRYFCRALELDAVFADLSAPDLPALQRGFEHTLASPSAPP